MNEWRFIPVVLLLGVATALLTPRGRTPLAMRGIKRILRRDLGSGAADAAAEKTVSKGRRLLAFALLLAAFALAVL